jgi:hypothetical protein
MSASASNNDNDYDNNWTEDSDDSHFAVSQIGEGVFNVGLSSLSLSSLNWDEIPLEVATGAESKKRPEVRDQSVQVAIQKSRVITGLNRENAELKQRIATLDGKVTMSRKGEEGFEWLCSSPAKFYFYTGLTQDLFEVLLQFLGPEAENLKMWGPRQVKMEPRFQLALTLMRLRQSSMHQDLSYRFKICRPTVGNIFITWIQFMFKTFSELRGPAGQDVYTS